MPTAQPLPPDDGRALVDEATSAVSYLRITIEDPADGWVPCTAILDDPDALRGAIDATTAARPGVDRDDVALSLFVQGYAFRVAAVAIVPWVLRGDALDVAPTSTAIGLGQGRPNAVDLRPAVVLAGADAALVHDRLVEGHLAWLVDSARRVRRIGLSLLWGNVTAGIVSAFAAAGSAHRDGWDRVGPLADEFLRLARREVSNAGELVHVGIDRQWERRSCCLWYLTGAAMCSDCSLQPPDGRRDRYDALLAQQRGTVTP
jgi:ferric iron reductase protein FhuF